MSTSNYFIFLRPLEGAVNGSVEYTVIVEVNGGYVFVKKEVSVDLDEFRAVSSAWPNTFIYVDFSDFDGEQREQLIWYISRFGWCSIDSLHENFNILKFVIDLNGK